MSPAEQTSGNGDVHKLLTIVITTSPVKSHPSLALIECVLSSFGHVPELHSCRKVIVADGTRPLNACLSKSHDSAKRSENDREQSRVGRKYKNLSKAMRSGYVDDQCAVNYAEYKWKLSARCAADEGKEWHPSDALFANTRLLYLQARHGYAYSLREALRPERGLVTTPYVCVVQHDRTFLRSVPVAKILHAMEESLSRKCPERGICKFESSAAAKSENVHVCQACCQPVHSVGLLTRSNVNYLARVSGRPFVRKENLDLNSLTWVPSAWENSDVCGRLVPLIHFYDSTHIARTDHYINFIVNPKRRIVARGGFVEEGVTSALHEAIRREGFVVGHGVFGCYLFEEPLGLLTQSKESDLSMAPDVGSRTRGQCERRAHRRVSGHVGHLDGGSFTPWSQQRRNSKQAVEQ